MAIQTNFAAYDINVGIRDQRGQQFTVFAEYEIIQRGADELFERNVKNFGKTAVGIENGAVVGKSCGAFVDGFDHQAIGMFRTLQRENLIAVRARDQHSVDFAHADGAKGFFQFRDARMQIGYSARIGPAVFSA